MNSVFTGCNVIGALPFADFFYLLDALISMNLPREYETEVADASPFFG